MELFFDFLSPEEYKKKTEPTTPEDENDFTSCKPDSMIGTVRGNE